MSPSTAALLAAPRRALLVGMGVTNRAVAGALLRRGHDVTAVDDRVEDELRSATSDLGIELVESPASDATAELVARSDFVVAAPGLPEHHLAFAAADAAARPVISELDLAAVWDDRPVAAVTGTNGKTTVVELTVAALEHSGVVAVAAGNTEVPLVAAIDDPAAEVFVVEASSFRLARTAVFGPLVATWINFAPDHLDVHTDLAAYEAAKARIWAHLPHDGVAVANALDPVVMAHIPADRAVETFGTPSSTWRVEADKLVGPDGAFTTVDRLWRTLPHDLEDALASAATARGVGASLEGIAAAVESFKGLAHRVSPVGTVRGSVFYDDSKSTTPHATLAALTGFTKVVLIAGGRNKGIDLAALSRGASHVHAVVAIGEAADEVAAAFPSHEVRRAVDMDAAVAVAAELAAGGVPVLLSPGCASFDWYGSYRERGDDFVRAVAELGGTSS